MTIYTDIFGTAAELDDSPSADETEIDKATLLDNPRIAPRLVEIGIKERFRLISFSELKPGNDRNYLIKNLIPKPGVTLIWGAPKCGKSFWAFDAVMHVALGWDYRGNRVQQGEVVYLALEGATGFRLRAEAFRRQFPDMLENPPFALIADAVDLISDYQALIAAIRKQARTPAVVVIDTLNRSLKGAESSDEDMAAFIRAADTIRDAFDCAVIIVHHCGHNDTRPRGHSSLLGAVDAQIAVARDKANNIVCTVERMKDGPEGAMIMSRLVQVELGIDEDGDPITSCVVAAVEGYAKAAARPPKLTNAATIALRALNEALDGLGSVPPSSNYIPANVKTVTLDQWRRYAYQMGISGSAEARAMQKAFERAREYLQAKSYVAVWGGQA